MTEDPKPKAPAAPKPTPPPKAPPAAPPVPKTAAGRAALERFRAKADWDVIASAAIKASGIEAELQALRARHLQLAEAGHQVCDSISPLFVALAREPRT